MLGYCNAHHTKVLAYWTIILTLIAGIGCSTSNTKSPEGSDKASFVYPGIPPEVGWWHDAVFYEIFVRSFADSNGDGIGDFRGLTEKLDYLNDGDPQTSNDLGINAVWLMPVFSSPSYHGYDVVDYKAVEPDYGSLEDFDAFVRAAHDRGIRVILDYVPNHASSQHPMFVSSKTKNSPDRNKFIWRDVPPEGWSRPWDGQPVWYQEGDAFYYGLFWSGMPDWNFTNPEVEAMHLDNMRFWMKRGIDGFRIDAAPYLFESEDGELSDQPETHALIKRLHAALTADFPYTLLVAEAWANIETVATYYDEGDQYQLAFGFDTHQAIIDSVNKGTSTDLNQIILNATNTYSDTSFEAPFLTNHDMMRVMQQFGGNVSKARVAAATLMAMSGTPFLYYGEEIGMQGGTETLDEDKRTPMHWNTELGYGFSSGRPWHDAKEAAGVDVASQRSDPKSLWSLYKDLIVLRLGHPALPEGKETLPAITGGGSSAIAILRTHDDETTVFVVNFQTKPTGSLQVSVAGNPSVLLAEGLMEPIQTQTGKLIIPGLGARGFAFIRLEN